MTATATVSPEKISRDLQTLWAQLAQDQAETGGVLKACAMTLVVVASNDEDSDRVRQTLGVLMHDHPSRAIVIRPAGDQFDARVFAECWKPFGHNQQICADGIEITPGGEGLEEAARFVVPLRVPDLPVVLWCRGAVDQTYMYRRRFDPLYALADKIIFDSHGVLDAEAGVEFLRTVAARYKRVADLHWARLTGWRELLAHLFDDRAMHPADVTAAHVHYGGKAASTCALYFAAWIRSALPGVRVTMEARRDPAADGGLTSVTLESSCGTLCLSRDSDGMRVTGCGREYRLALPPTDEEALMRQELKILGPDPVWDRALQGMNA